jgi:hypothetical protein
MVVLPAGFLIFWCWLIWFLAHISGWSNLAHYYRATGPFHGTVRHFRSGQLGWSNYGLCLTIGTNAEGLYLAVLLPFRPGHPPLFVPWAQVRARYVRVWFTHRLEVRFERFPLVAFKFPARLGRQIAAEASRSWEHDPSPD